MSLPTPSPDQSSPPLDTASADSSHQSLGDTLAAGTCAVSNSSSQRPLNEQGGAVVVGIMEETKAFDRDEEAGGVRVVESNETTFKGKGDPFADKAHGGIQYQTMAWWQCGMIMIAETISLGILSLPSVLAAIGLVPGLILIAGLGVLATYTGYVLGQFKLRYPHVHNMADAGEVMLGAFGRELFGGAQMLFLIFIMGSHILTFSIMMNTITDHGACTIIFNFIGMVVSFICCLPRTLYNVSWLAIASFISIFAAVMVTMIGAGVEQPSLSVDATRQVTFFNAFFAVTNIIFAYAGHVAFFSFMSEMRHPEQYPKALFLLQGADTTMYVVVALVIYRYTGRDVASPALGSTGPVVSKVAYGIAIPTIVIAGVINGHVAAKYIYIRLFRGTAHIHSRSLTSSTVWILLVLGLWILAWIIACAIPVFNDLLSLITSLFASWFTYGLSGAFWLFLNWGRYSQSKRKMFLTGFNALIFCIGATICGLGLWVSGVSIHDHATSANGSFSCADNASS